MSKRAAGAAFQLLSIFLLFGMPYILQSDNGSEFTAEVIHELKDTSPLQHIVHIKLHHLQCQRSVKGLMQTYMLAAWLSYNSTQDWSLDFATCRTKRTVHVMLVLSAHHTQPCLDVAQELN